MVVSNQISSGICGNVIGEKEFKSLKREVNVVQRPDGSFALQVDTGAEGKPTDPNHQHYRRLSISIAVTSGTAVQISNLTGVNGTNTINSIAPGGYVVNEIFIMASGVLLYNATIIIYRGSTATANIVTEMNINEGGISLMGGEKNNNFSTNPTYIRIIGYTGNINMVIGFWY